MADRLTRHSNKRPRQSSVIDIVDLAPNDRCVKLFNAAFVCELYDAKYDPKPRTKGTKIPPYVVYVAVLRKAYHCPRGKGSKASNYGYIQPGRTAGVAASFSYYSTVGDKGEKDDKGKWKANLQPIDFTLEASQIKLVMRKQLACDLKNVDLDGDNMLPVLRPVALINSGDGYYTVPAEDLQAVRDYIEARSEDPMAGL